jgi:sugar lactone lactonase YvrE
MTSLASAEPVTDPLCEHGEGPVWLPGGGLRWVDMLAGDLMGLHADGSVTRDHLGPVLAALRPRASGGLVVALEREFALVDPDGTVHALDELWTDPAVRMNDGGCDPDGRFYCGSMAYDTAPGRGSLYRLDPDGSARMILDDLTISNGLAWSPDGGTAYYVDTPTQRIDAFDYDREKGLTGRRPVAQLADAPGHPDGLTVDAEGALWVAMHDGGVVLRYWPDGRPDGQVPLPVRMVTACTFGGPRLDQLFITTSRLGLEPGEEPASGSLYRADVGVTGLPAATFAG